MSSLKISSMDFWPLMRLVRDNGYELTASVTKRSNDEQRTFDSVAVEELDRANNLVLVDEDGQTKAIAVEGLRHIWIPELDLYQSYSDT